MNSLLKVTRWVILLALASCNVPQPTPSRPGSTSTPISSVSLTTPPLETQSGFKLHPPAELPDDYIFQEAAYLPESQALTLLYVWQSPLNTGELLSITQQRQKPLDNISEQATLETVPIGNYSASFVQGNWFDGKWEKDAPVFRLRWNTSEFYFTVLFSGNERSSLGFLTKEKLIALAEQMQ